MINWRPPTLPCVDIETVIFKTTYNLRRYREMDFKRTYKGNICRTFCKPYEKNIKSWQLWQQRGWETTILINSLMCPQSQSPPSTLLTSFGLERVGRSDRRGTDVVFFQSYFCSHLQITLGNFGESLSPLLTSFGLERVGTPGGKSLIRRLIFQCLKIHFWQIHFHFFLLLLTNSFFLLKLVFNSFLHFFCLTIFSSKTTVFCSKTLVTDRYNWLHRNSIGIGKGVWWGLISI